MLDEPLIYDAEITGDVPPYKWAISRTTDGRRSVVSGCSGHADTFEDAIRAADEAARAVEAKRRHEATKRTVTLFHVETPPLDMSQFEEAFVDLADIVNPDAHV